MLGEARKRYIIAYNKDDKQFYVSNPMTGTLCESLFEAKLFKFREYAEDTMLELDDRGFHYEVIPVSLQIMLE